MESLNYEIQQIKERNKKVETDKAWEVSWTRRLSIAVLTYIVVVIWLVITKESSPLLKALVPMIGYLLSTISIPFIKSIWIAKRK